MFKSAETHHRKSTVVAENAEARRVNPKAFIKFLSAALCVICACALNVSFAQTSKYQNIGRTATPQEIKAWDIDVRPDFKGLPAGQGSVKQGEAIWEAQCESCHGHFGESAEVFTPIAGGVTADDMKTGRVKSLVMGANQPQRTTLMKLPTLSTLWDYINRAMPWNAPKSLTTDQVYAVTAYTLHLNNILPADFVLSDVNIRDVQARLPNRNGMTTAHSLWPGREFSPALNVSNKPDVQGTECMANCGGAANVVSSLPDHARNAHGNLADQSRSVGPSRGAETMASIVKVTQLSQSTAPNTAVAQVNATQAASENIAPTTRTTAVAPAVTLASIKSVLDKNACLACHGMNNKLVGPSFKDIAARYKTTDGALALLSGKIKNGGQGAWGSIPMPAQALSVAESAQVAKWLMGGLLP